MSHRLKQLLLLFAILATLYSFVPAQESQPSPQISSSQTPELQELATALALEDASDRVLSLQQFLKSHPDSPRADSAREAVVQSLAGQAEMQLASQNIEQAVASFRVAMTSLPKQISDSFFENTLIRIPLAMALRGYRTEAITFAREIEAHISESAVRMGALSEFYLSLEDSVDAIRTLEAAKAITPQETRVHRTLGAAYRMGLRLDDAMKEYRSVIEIDPGDKRAYYELGNLSRSQGAYEESLKLCRKQLEIDPGHLASSKGIALALLAQGKSDLANAEIEKLRGLAGNSDEVSKDYFFQTQLAFYFLLHGQIVQARKITEQVIATEPRFVWARIAAAEVDLAEDHYFEAERHLMAAKQYGNFPTLDFTLGKVYLAVEDFDYSLVQFAKAFSYSVEENFKTRLGSVVEVSNSRLGDLLAREQQAAIFLFEPPTSYAQFRLAESLVKMDAVIRSSKNSFDQSRAGKDRDSASQRSTEQKTEVSPDSTEIEKAVDEFVEADARRRPYRALYVAQRLAQSGQWLEVAVKYAKQAGEDAEAATEPAGSLRDYPNYDRDGRWRVFRGRATDAQGWALFKKGQNAEAITVLTSAVESYGNLPEGKRAQWHLAAAKEAAGDLKEALELYVAAYEPPNDRGESDVNRAIIESLYRKLHGSLNGLSDRIGKPVQVLSVKKTEPSGSAGLNERPTAREELKPPTATGKTSVAIEAKPADNEVEKRSVSKETSLQNREPLKARATIEQQNFNIILPGSLDRRPLSDAQKENSEEYSKSTAPGAGNQPVNEAIILSMPVDLPAVKAGRVDSIKPQEMPIEKALPAIPEYFSTDTEEPVPLPVISAKAENDSPQNKDQNSPKGIRPRRVTIDKEKVELSAPPAQTRKRRVANPTNNPPDQQ